MRVWTLVVVIKALLLLFEETIACERTGDFCGGDEGGETIMVVELEEENSCWICSFVSIKSIRR